MDMKTTMVNEIINQFFLPNSYDKDCPAFQIVRRGLLKMSQEELGSMSVLLLCRKDPASDAKHVVSLKLCYNSDFQEYTVKYYLDGVFNADASYSTDDKNDAIETMRAMKKEATERGFVVEMKGGAA